MDIQQILQNIGIERLTAMQKASLEAFCEPKDMVLLSPTGTGKTLAFLIPLIMNLKTDVEEVQAVVLVPSRELALQIETVFKQMNTPFRAMSCYGGRPTMDEHRTMNGTRPTVIIATPGRLNDHLRKHNFNACKVETLIIDEFDKCLEFGFHEEMSEVILQLPSLKKRVLLSATDAEEIPQFVGVGGNSKSSYLKIDYLPTENRNNRLKLMRVLSPEKDKLNTLFGLLCNLGDASTLVFVNYRESVERITAFLRSKKFPCEQFHGGMEQYERERALYKFRNGSCPVLISTDLAARGLDIACVENVVHYHLPLNEEAFTHRNGRTARWEADGSSFLIHHIEERLPEYIPNDIPVFEQTEPSSKPPKACWTTLYIGKGKKEKLNKIDIAGFLYKKGGLQKDELGQIDVKEHYSFVAIRRNKVKQVLAMVQGEKIKGVKTIFEEAK